MKAISRFLLLFLPIALFIQCEERVIIPKPRGYPKIEFPKKGMTQFTEDYCNMTFQYPSYAEIERNEYFFGEKAPNECWFNIYFPAFDAKLHCSYLPINKENNIVHLQEQTFKMTQWHNKKASYIDEQTFENAQSAIGMTFDVEGPVASPFQFFVTDSLQQRHFFRAAFYFNSQVQADSLAPIYSFIKEDLDKMLTSFEWR